MILQALLRKRTSAAHARRHSLTSAGEEGRTTQAGLYGPGGQQPKLVDVSKYEDYFWDRGWTTNDFAVPLDWGAAGLRRLRTRFMMPSDE
jgi:hypothetical protein